MSLYAKLNEVAQQSAEKPCLLLPDGETVTFKALFDQSNRVAAVLRLHGVDIDDRVVVQCEKTPLTLALYLACLQVGAIYVPLNTSYTTAELTYFLDNAKPKLYVGSTKLEGLASDSLHQLTVVLDGEGTLANAVANVEKGYEQVTPRGTNDIAAILYTSGTTGRSKGAMLTHGNLLSNAETLNDFWGFRADDVLVHALPMYHVHGLFVAIHCVLLSGSAMIFQQKFDVHDVLAALPNATVLMGVPTFYTRLLGESEFDKQAVRNMRLFISGSAPLTEQTFREFENRTGMQILERYGMSETLMNTSNPLEGAEVETAVGDLPDVADVAVIGAPHRDFGEGVIAVTVSKSGQTLDTNAVRSQLKDVLAGYKRPLLVVTTKELPRNAMGKIQKNVLRDEFKDVFSQEYATSS